MLMYDGKNKDQLAHNQAVAQLGSKSLKVSFYSEAYPDKGETEDGMRTFFKQFSFSTALFANTATSGGMQTDNSCRWRPNVFKQAVCMHKLP